MAAVPRRVRVVTLIDLIGPIGGAERLAALLPQRLDRDRFEPWVCVSYWDPAAERDGAMGAAIDELERDGVRVFGLARTGTKDILNWRVLASELRRGGVEVLHAHKFGSNLWGTLVGRLAGTPVVVSHEHTWSYEGEPVRKLLDRHVIARGSDAFVAVSREDRRRMIEIEGVPPDKAVYVPNGAPRSPPPSGRDVRGELGIPPDAPVIGSVGMLRAQKAFEVLIEAAATLREQHPALRVLIAGDGPERDALTALIAERGLEETVLLLGHRDDATDLVSSFDVAVTSSDYEGMPVSVLEYMEAERPVVSTRVGGLPDMVEDGVHGLLVPPRDPAALAGAVDALLRDPARRAEMGAKGRERRRSEFDIDTMVRRIEELYLELLSRRRATADAAGPSASSSHKSF